MPELFNEITDVLHEFDVDIELGVKVIINITRLVEGGDGFGAFNGALDVLSEVVEADKVPPTMTIDIVPRNVLAGILFAAADDTGGERLGELNVAECDVLDRDQRLCITLPERVKLAALLLLGADVDGPVGGALRVDLMVGDVTDDAAGAGLAARRASLTRLDVDRLGRVIVPVVVERDVPDATVVIAWNN